MKVLRSLIIIVSGLSVCLSVAVITAPVWIVCSLMGINGPLNTIKRMFNIILNGGNYG